MTRTRAAALAPLWLAAGAVAAQTCGETLPGDRHTVENSHYVLAYATTPDPIAVGQHFVVDFAVCPRGNASAPQAVRIDANMPEHRHGMNYRPGVTVARPGTYHAEGLLFHMPGRWEFVFELGPERLTHSVRIE